MQVLTNSVFPPISLFQTLALSPAWGSVGLSADLEFLLPSPKALLNYENKREDSLTGFRYSICW